jgi:hypothetical protein
MKFTSEQPNEGRLSLDPDTLPWESCSCGGMIFDSGVMVKKVSALISPTGREEVIPADMITCRSCGKIPEFYAKRVKGLPVELISKSSSE